MIQVDVLQFLIEKGPGRTEIELARAIHGDKAYQQQVNQDLTLVVGRGKAERRGEGGQHDPFRYYPI
ncbi:MULTISPECIES: hypothetical protein [unclassified Bradyrhizobium]|uniref:hypothetical protein n=1 Tax=unclassified Bradyrhizobium TaxID=2631580 RepID=UPI001FFA5C55|nr:MULTISPECIES: hypothetical protein [unclassified Bradyrhizobium]MCK1289370.1 hypothetical protein [Bradyrhizobium sp. 30]MCK1497888.1 hypothetical protein [Bradyrhizobium sp. 188]